MVSYNYAIGDGLPTDERPFDFGTDTPGHPKYLTRPLSELNTIPYRGAGMAAHALDTDVMTAEYGKHENQTGQDDGGKLEEWVAPVPLIVSVVDMPHETEERYSRIVTLFGANESYTYTSLGAFDAYPPRILVPKDDTRTKATIIASPSPALATGTGSGQYGFLISTDQNCTTGLLMGAFIAAAGAPGPLALVEFLGKSAIFGRLVPLAAYDSTKTNYYSLAAVVETSTLTNLKTR